jgi:hypothetical protein
MSEDPHDKEGGAAIRPSEARERATTEEFDVVMFAGKTEDGEGAQVLRARPGKVEAGEVRPVREGKPIASGEVVRLERRQDAPALYDVHVLHTVEPPASRATRAGPAQVATDEYRRAWERTFGTPEKSLN